jgi:hypothetical protein
MARTFGQQKAGLTRALKTRNHAAVVAECRRVIAEWEGLPHGWPDDWHRWNRALDDAWGFARDAYMRRDIDEMPQSVDMDDLRADVRRERAEALAIERRAETLAAPAMTMSQVASLVDGPAAQLAIARAMQILGSTSAWTGTTFEEVRAALHPAFPGDLPSVDLHSSGAFWEGVA